MTPKYLSIIGCPFTDFQSMLRQGDRFRAQKAKLITTYKLGDEMANTSVFLASLKLVSEFRKTISSNFNLAASGKIHIFTEIEFIDFENKRVDGMICIERGGKIIDTALLEMKNGRNPLELDQINAYIEIADAYKIPKLITVSNQFVSHPTQSPLAITKKRKVELYHLSWSYILTIAHILLTDNETNIEDNDQFEIMKEVVDYLEHPKSGISGFTIMKDGWKIVTERVNNREKLKRTDPDVIEAVESWLQEEKDMALILSRQLGILVSSGVNKYKADLRGRIDDEVKSLIDKQFIESILKVDGAASSLTIRASFLRRSIEYITTLQAPQDKPTIRGQIGWIKKQITRFESKSPDLYEKLSKRMLVCIKLKNHTGEERILFSGLDEFALHYKDSFIKECGIVLLNDMGKNFSSPKKNIEQIESLLLDYYQCVVQHLVKWQKPVPEIKSRVIFEATEE